MQPFKGVRVLDLTHVLAGPFCTYQLAALGADVIKIEGPDHPDMTRDEGVSPDLNAALRGTYFMGQASAKRSLVLDLKTDQGKQVFLRLVKSADVLVQNYAGDTLDRMGLGHEDLNAINPRLIQCSMTGYGRTGPKADHPAYDVVIQAWSGMMYANGWSPNDPPLRVGPPIVDYGTGSQAAFAVAAALFQREKTGTGQQIDVSMADAAMMMMTPFVVDAVAAGQAPRPFGNTHPVLPHYSAYETASGWIMLGAYTIKQCTDLMRSLGFEAQAAEIAHLSKSDMPARAGGDRKLIAARLSENTAQYWEDRLNAAHVPAARIRRIEETVQEEQVASRKVLQPFGLGMASNAPAQLPMAAFSFAHDGPALATPPPGFGEHSIEILSELGLGAAEIEDLIALGVCKDST